MRSFTIAAKCTRCHQGIRVPERAPEIRARRLKLPLLDPQGAGELGIVAAAIAEIGGEIVGEIEATLRRTAGAP